MRIRRGACALFLWLLSCATGGAEVFVRWDQDQVPPPESLGLTTLVVPATNGALVKAAIASGYRVYLEIDQKSASSLPASKGGVAGLVVKGSVSAAQMRQLRLRFDRIVTVNEFGKWPHIRTNWVTKNNEVLQVTGRSAQPWIENNAALFRILRASSPAAAPTVTYPWQPITLSDIDEGPALEDYLVAIAEAGSFGADLVLPLHARFERRLLLGGPQARAEWTAIRRYVEFYSWNLPSRYQPVVDISVIARDPMAHFETMNLLARHNLPFEIVAPAGLNNHLLDRSKLVIVLDSTPDAPSALLDEFARKGGIVHRVQKPIADPNAFALEIRRLLGSANRTIDIWNGITVLAAPYRSPDGRIMLVTVLNYAHQQLPVQLRVPGTYSVIHYESPEETATLIAPQHRNGFTEFVLPALGVGGRVFLEQGGTVDR
jgi:hypothetical protein